MSSTLDIHAPLTAIYPDIIDDYVPSIPTDLQYKVEALADIIRFNDPEYLLVGMVNDNVKLHTIRCVQRVKYLCDNDEIIERMLWIHDIPELKVGDACAVSKDRKSAQNDSHLEKEEAAAIELLDAHDCQLLKWFNEAEVFFSGEGQFPPSEPASLLAKVVDYCDGNLVFHYFFTKWLRDHEYDGLKPTKSVFDYTLTQFLHLRKVLLASYSYDTIYTDLSLFCLVEEVNTVVEMYESLGKSRTPDYMWDVVLKLKTHLSDIY